jgi:hypothetical protein
MEDGSFASILIFVKFLSQICILTRKRSLTVSDFEL